MKKDHEIEDLLANKDFIEWVINPNQGNNYFWEKWIENHPEKRESVDKAVFIIKSVYHTPRKSASLRYNQILNDVLKEKYSSRGKEKNERFGRKLNALKVAASLLLLFAAGYYFFLFNQPSPHQPPVAKQLTKYAPRGEKLTFKLPDSTFVTLNSGSRIIYPASLEEAEARQVILSGEAYFDINHNPDKPFEVKTGDITVTALGTSFNVQAYPGDNHISVALLTGKVKIISQSADPGQAVYLTPGNKYTLDKTTDQVTHAAFKPDDEIAWKNGILLFSNDNLNSFISKIEMWYGVDVEVRGAPKEEWNVTGKFNNLSLDLLLESVQYIQDIEYAIDKKNVILVFKT